MARMEELRESAITQTIINRGHIQTHMTMRFDGMIQQDILIHRDQLTTRRTMSRNLNNMGGRVI